MSYRYAYVVSAGGPAQLGETLLPERWSVQLARTTWRPPADVIETRDAIEITLDLAGVDPEQIDVQLYEDAVVVEGQRRLEREGVRGRYHAAEIRQGPFRYELVLPAAFDAEQVSAQYDQGLLRMSFPKVTAAVKGEHRGG
jgi:HSP20 family protein